jgi:hypothetical protein
LRCVLLAADGVLKLSDELNKKDVKKKDLLFFGAVFALIIILGAYSYVQVLLLDKKETQCGFVYKMDGVKSKYYYEAYKINDTAYMILGSDSANVSMILAEEANKQFSLWVS